MMSRVGVGIIGLEAESEIQQDEGIHVEVEDAAGIQGDPEENQHSLSDEKKGRAKEPGEGLCLQSKPVLTEYLVEMPVRQMEAEMVVCWRRRRWGRLVHGGW